ncbi:zinc ribbon domain-containing protein [Streptomyces sp. AA0539]|uniref:zinc ribbon domain-containing protein n=1 Tax=Streptomyces sp. AA0539 TaxID=1210045 RepID=UPI00030CD6F8|nr:zinc ribbon domain-containing protein [Streptomyces sp. AA0539]
MTTPTCSDCGTAAEPGQSFCEACGAVLGWRDPAGERPGQAGAAALNGSEAATARVPRGGTATVPEGAGATGLRKEPATRKEPAAEPEPAPAPPPAPPAGATPPEVTPERARQLLVPVAEPEPADGPEAVAPTLPGRPSASRPVVRGPGREAEAEGGVPCTWCGTLNRPDRHYCGRCAMSLAAAEEAPERLPWWRRLFDRDRREAPWAGQRPRLDRTFGHLLKWVAVGLAVGLLVATVIYLPTGIQATRDHFAKRAPVAPDSTDASLSWGQHGPELAFDLTSNTWWGPGITHSAEGEWIEARFSQPTDLLDVVITPGVSAHANQLSEATLPRTLEARVTTSDGGRTTHEISLDQGAGPQARTFRAKDVISVRFTILAAYAPSEDKQVAIAEIEFFGPSASSWF